MSSDPIASDAEEAEPGPAPFGTLLGVAPGNVPVYSSDYETADSRQLPDRSAFRSYLDGLYMGYKWQCVEFARRSMYLNTGCVFDDVAMAHEIFRLRSVREVKTGRTLPLYAFRNGSRRPPEPGCLLIWEPGGEFEHTGHVAVVTEVGLDSIRFAEQNVGHRVWPEGRSFARELHTKVTEEGEYWVECSFKDATILGWVIQTDDPTHAEPMQLVDPRLFEIEGREVEKKRRARKSWLNVANADEAAYVEVIGGHRLATRDEDQRLYFAISETAHDELVRATGELHGLFMHATEHVLRDENLLARFNLPRSLWGKIHESWDNRLNQMITGRFDFALSARGIKVFEYNADSAACHMECGKIQGRWAAHYGCEVGRDPGESLHDELVDAWRASDVDSTLHIMQDRDPEETYHALFMQEALEEAGIECKILKGMDGLAWDAMGNILDPDGEPIRWVWKTWAWETALDQIRAECGDDPEKLRTYKPGQRPGGPGAADAPRLVDVLLRKSVMVFEPLWTLIPSNKAILPVLFQLFPECPYLLRTSFELTGALREQGYVSKPIVGRCGSNIRIFDREAGLIEETSGAFDRQEQIYQELHRLPVVAGYNVQISTFTAGGTWAGTCLRADKQLILSQKSDNLPLRVVPDHELEGRRPGSR
ncbi:MAG: bifunctional glutathionylspermidine amidase/synthase [Deltaproteobacteria bacterium]|nr:bifunctional glutathionylspermidine amidase/synthase [Deltaproteobacteria bacterium]